MTIRRSATLEGVESHVIGPSEAAPGGIFVWFKEGNDFSSFPNLVNY